MKQGLTKTQQDLLSKLKAASSPITLNPEPNENKASKSKSNKTKPDRESKALETSISPVRTYDSSDLSSLQVDKEDEMKGVMDKSVGNRNEVKGKSKSGNAGLVMKRSERDGVRLNELGHERLNELKRKSKSLVGEGQPHPSPAYNPQTTQDDVEDIVSKMPLHSKQISKQILSYLSKLQYLALARAEKLLLKPSDLPPSELIKLTTQLKDMQLTVKWTHKLEDAILNNPSKLLPTGSGKGFSLLARLKELTSATKKELNQDHRQSGLKNSASYNVIPLPQDDDNKKIAGA